MIEQKEHFHGSDLEKIEKIYGIHKEDIVSFAANVNPLGISFCLRETLANHLDAITTYPDREYTSLRNCIAQYVTTDLENVLVGNGSSELISLFIQYSHPQKALIIGPTYSEYEREVSLSGGRSMYFRLPETDSFKLPTEKLLEALSENVDLLILCNPNNPTGSIISRSDMYTILDYCKQKAITVLVDETYIEFAPDTEALTSIPLTRYYNNIIILRGISKFFAAPGLRLGYAICSNHDLLREINKKKNPWTINSLAAIAGEIMFTDQDYQAHTKELIQTERERIVAQLESNSRFQVYPTYANFILIKLLDKTLTSEDYFDACIRQCMMIRDCSTFPFLDNHFIRFCFMKPEQNDALLKLLFELK